MTLRHFSNVIEEFHGAKEIEGSETFSALTKSVEPNRTRIADSIEAQFHFQIVQRH
jgi:hypothetical protein